jgi:hypothetical protein
MNKFFVTIIVVVVVFVGAWLFRYEPMPVTGAPVLLDRWTGNVLIARPDGIKRVTEEAAKTRDPYAAIVDQDDPYAALVEQYNANKKGFGSAK